MIFGDKVSLGHGVMELINMYSSLQNWRNVMCLLLEIQTPKTVANFPKHFRKKFVYYKSLKPLKIEAQWLKIQNQRMFDMGIKLFPHTFYYRNVSLQIVSNSGKCDWMTWTH
jgi:hypothetical protein